MNSVVAAAAAGAAMLMVGLLPAAGRAEAMPPAPAKPGCHCPPVSVRHHVWHARSSRRFVRRWHRRWLSPVALVAPPVPVYFNTEIPSTLNPGYDRAMVLLFRSPAVSGIYTDDPGYPTTPVVAGIAPYQRTEGGVVFQYDGMTGQYIQLSQSDAARVPPPPPGSVPVPPAQ
jgi:hypothetical protein